MMNQHINSILLKSKPARLLSPSRLLYFSFFVVVLASCATNKKIADSPSKKAVEKTVAIQRDSVIETSVADAIFMDAVKAKMLNKSDEAYKQFSLLASTGNLGATPHYELSRIWLEKNNVPKALSEIKLATQKDSANKWIQSQYADLLAYDGQYLKAAEVYRKLAMRERHPEEYLLREAMLFQKAQKYAEALKVLTLMEQYVGADDESTLLQKQQLYLQLNDVDGAAREVEKLINYYPQEPRYPLLLADLYLNNNVKKDIEAIYKNTEAKFPNEPAVQFALVQYYLKKKDSVQFQVYLEKAILNKDVPIEDRISLLVPFIELKGTDSAAKEMTFALVAKLAGQEPPTLDAVLLYADMLAADNRLDDALGQYKKSIDIDSTNVNAWQQVLFIHAARSQPDSLIAYGTRAVKNFPKEPLLFYFGGLGFLQAKQYDSAINYFNNTIALQTRNTANLLPEILVSLGDAYNSAGKFKLSDSCYREALSIQPDNAMALNNFSYYLSERGENLDEAEKMSAKSLKLRPDEATFLDTYGWILYKQGKYAEAKKYIRQAIDKTNNEADGTLWEHLGDIEYKLGNIQQAIIHWQKAKEKGDASEALIQKLKEQKLKD